MPTPQSTPLRVYGGTITQIITATDDPRYYVGQVFSGYFQFNSDDGNGTFYATGVLKPKLNNSLRGIVFAAFTGALGKPVGLTETANDGVLTVAAGAVKSFKWQREIGDNYFSIDAKTFRASKLETRDPKTGAVIAAATTVGTVVMGSPVQQKSLS
jgi:hypothetical protein